MSQVEVIFLFLTVVLGLTNANFFSRSSIGIFLPQIKEPHMEFDLNTMKALHDGYSIVLFDKWGPDTYGEVFDIIIIHYYSQYEMVRKLSLYNQGVIKRI